MTRKDIEDRITQEVLKQLRDGKVPWRKPWTSAGYMPTSLSTGKSYRGVNALLLSMVGGEYERPLWATYKQSLALGGQVRKGEHGYPVVFFSPITKETNGKESSYFMLKTYTVFNVAQCDGLTLPEKYTLVREPIATAPALDAILSLYPNAPEVRYVGQDRAYYSPSQDRVTLPALDQFASVEDHAYTLLHELTHSTGHESRLNRFEKDSGSFGCETYAKEELVADIGAQMLMSNAGIESDLTNSAAYIAGWLGALLEDTGLILKAAALAQRATDYILNINVKEEKVAA